MQETLLSLDMWKRMEGAGSLMASLHVHPLTSYLCAILA